MTKQSMLRIAVCQSALEHSCKPEDFFSDVNVVVQSQHVPGARRYLTLPFDCQLTSYGSNIVASVRDDVRGTVETYLKQATVGHCFETPSIHALDEALAPFDLRTCFMAEYFLPDPALIPFCQCPYPVRLLTPPALNGFYTPSWSNALSLSDRERDVLAAVAYDGETPVGMAGCSADCTAMWQIGVDVLPAYRRKGIACALTVRLAREIMRRGKVPFYCAAWCNLRSVRNALKAGFRPAWVELTAKPKEDIVSFLRPSNL